MPRNPDRETVFRFKKFEVVNSDSAMKVGTDGVLLGAWFDMPAGGSVLDVGTGCGLIALMAAQRGASSVDAVEIDAAAADEARRNVASSPWSDRIEVIHADFLVAGLEGHYDRVVSNPPYFVTGEIAPDGGRAMARHEGTLTVAALLRRARCMLAPGGRVALVTPADRYDDVLTEAAFAGLDTVRLCRVSTKEGKSPVRILWELAVGSEGPCSCESMLIGSSGYRELVEPFYLKI